MKMFNTNMFDKHISLKKIIESFFFFIIGIFKKRTYDVIFYYPAHFNRGGDGSNSFFEPFYQICENNNISYLVFEEPELSKKSFRNDNAVPFDFIYFLILIMRKIISLEKFDSFQQREWAIAKKLKVYFLRNFQFDNYIVLSNSMMGFFRGLNNKAKLFDYQHGIIYSTHWGYIDNDGNIPAHIKENDTNLLVYGDGFKKLLIRTEKDHYYKTHVFSVGQGLKGDLSTSEGVHTILVSLQLADSDKNLNMKLRDIMVDFFEIYEDFFIQNNIKVLLKHHPRFQHDIHMKLLYKFDFISIYQGTLIDALSKSNVHITFNSTVTFEAASKGIPTLLMKNNLFNPEFFIKDYQYPLGIQDGREIINSLEKYINEKDSYMKDSKKVFEWYHQFYSEIDEQLFIDLIKGKNIEKN